MNLPVPDRSVPSDTDGFLHSVERLAQMAREGQYIGVHCRASIGRSSVLAVSVLKRLADSAKFTVRGCLAHHAIVSAKTRVNSGERESGSTKQL
jgi:protein-tyrosine phosphatase